MNLLTDKLPTSVSIGSEEYPINSDYRTSVAFELLIQNASLSEEEKLLRALSLYYPKIPKDMEQAILKLLWFYRCGQEEEDSLSGGVPGQASGPAYSFDEDAPYFYAAFLSEYGIDLADIEHLHWWKFKALFEALGEDCRLMQIMSYRTMPLSPKMSKEQREFYARMKKIFALHAKGAKHQTLEEREQEMRGYVERRYREAGRGVT